MSSPRRFILALTACLTLGLSTTAVAENWIHRPDLGGWMDNETGLVWSLSSRTWTSAWYNYWGVVYNGVPAYQQMTGISKWRMPTLAEAKTAHAHNAYNYFSQTGDTTVAPSWVSDMKGKKQAYYFGYHNGQSVLTSINSVLAFRLVYRP